MQKNAKKKLFVVAVAVCLIAILSFTTLAWFSDSESIKNDFIVSSEDENPDDIFSIDVFEWVEGEDPDEPIKVDEGGHEFEDVVPGDELHKEPIVKNTGRYDQWVRLTLTFSDLDAWYAIQDGNTAEGPIKMLTKSADWDLWTLGDFSYDENGYVYVYYLNIVLEPNEEVGTFTHVNIPGGLDQEDMFNIKSLSLDVKAEAVQVENIDADNAKDAFALVEADHPIR